jgi:threonine dehydrogenase-like Zn-dependent dehydrogenase
LTGGRGVDVAIEALGRQETFENALRSIRPGGILSSLGVYSGKIVAPYEAFYAGLGDQKIVTTPVPEEGADAPPDGDDRERTG